MGLCFSNHNACVLGQKYQGFMSMRSCFTSWKVLMAFRFVLQKLWHSMVLLWSLFKSWRASDSSIIKPHFLASLRNLGVLSPVFFTWLCIILHDGGLQITGMAVDGLVNATPIHWMRAAMSTVNPLGLPTCYILKTPAFHRFLLQIVSGAPEIPDNGSDKLLKWRCTLADLLHYNVLDDSSTKENLRTPYFYTERTKRLATSKLFPKIIRLVYC